MVSWVCGLYWIRDVGDVKYTQYTRFWGVQTLGMWDVGNEGCWRCWIFGIWNIWDVGFSGCGVLGIGCMMF